MGVRTVTKIFITCDTELSAALFQAGADADDNFARSIDCNGWGVGWQMDQLDANSLNGVFFVDPMSALVYGIDVIARIVQPIVARGHEVQLHLHPEWLEWATAQPVGDRRGRSIADFDYDDQVTLLSLARQLLVDAGAPSPVAFRAGNYGANDDTLRALAALGIKWDASFNPIYAGDTCHIGLSVDQVDPAERLGSNEMPVSAIEDRPGHLRHTQICALSAAEMHAALIHAAETERPAFSIVTHSFEMMSRDRKRPNKRVIARYEAMCAAIAGDPRLESAGFIGLAFTPARTLPSRLSPSYVRTGMRMAEQAVDTLLYERG
jgi:hypothetical protein